MAGKLRIKIKTINFVFWMGVKVFKRMRRCFIMGEVNNDAKYVEFLM